MLSVIIPTRNNGSELAACLRSLRPWNGLVSEVVIVDGGSVPPPRAMLRGLPARVIATPEGRGLQLARGAKAAHNAWFLFLHSDTRLRPGWQAAVREFMVVHARPETAAGVFRLRLRAKGWRARATEWGAGLRWCLLRMPYGDQGLLIARATYFALGEYKPLALMEDVALMRKLPRRARHRLEEEAHSSAARYRRDGYARRWGINLACLILYYLGVRPARLARFYEQR